MELHSAEVVHDPPRPRGKRRRLGRGLVMVVAALGLIAIGALGATLAPRYLSGAQPIPVATAPTPSVSAPPASEPPAGSAPASTAGGQQSHCALTPYPSAHRTVRTSNTSPRSMPAMPRRSRPPASGSSSWG